MPLLGDGLAWIDRSSSEFSSHSYYTSGYKSPKQKRKEEAMTKNKTNKKRKRKKVLSAIIESNEEPSFMNSELTASRTSPRVEIPSLYKSDLGTAGVKEKKNGPILSGPQVPFSVAETDDEEARRKQRQRRFSSSLPSGDAPPSALLLPLSSSRVGAESSVENRKDKTSRGSGLVGTCQNLEKPYFRLTTFPKPEDVRPLDVLTKSLAHIKCRYVKTEDFEWANEQLKSVRQDITVQGLRCDLVLEAYETHARILLEQGDLNEFNQCQTMIRTLTTGITGSETDNDVELSSASNRSDSTILKQTEEASDEFGGYRLLYALVQNASGDVTKELRNARLIVNRDGQLAAADPLRCPRSVSCRHATQVVNAVIHNDYRAFFRLYESAPHLSAYLMDFLVKRVRLGAYKRIIAAYRPTISVEHVRVALCFQDLEEARRFLRHNGAAFVVENGEAPFWIDCKESK